jgi:hypothetical protein
MCGRNLGQPGRLISGHLTNTAAASPARYWPRPAGRFSNGICGLNSQQEIPNDFQPLRDSAARSPVRGRPPHQHLLLLEVFYKVLWLLIVAYPLWSTGTLAGSSAEGATSAFLGDASVILIHGTRDRLVPRLGIRMRPKLYGPYSKGSGHDNESRTSESNPIDAFDQRNSRSASRPWNWPMSLAAS